MQRGAPKPSIHDVADAAGVSISTVSRALAGTGRISPRTVSQVRAAAEQLGYRPNSVAAGLARGISQYVCLVVPDMLNPFFPELVQAIADRIEALGLHLLLTSHGDDPAQLTESIATMRASQVDRFLVVGTDGAPHPAIAEQFGDAAAVFVDRVESGRYPSVSSDHDQGGYLATQHLLALGHRHIAHLRGPAELDNAAARQAGYLRALSASPHAGPPVVVEAGFDEPAGRRGVTKMLAEHPECTAVFAANDMVAIGAMSEIEAAGLRVPEDLSVIGFDDIHVARYVRPRLTTVAQPLAELGRAAVALLIDPTGDHDAPPRRVTLDVSVVRRESTGRPRANGGGRRRRRDQSAGTPPC